MGRYTIHEMRTWAKYRGGECISEEYLGCKVKLKWQCKEGHIWEAPPNSIMNSNSWCPYCAGQPKITIQDMQKFAESRGGKCLSKRYVNMHTKLKWQCSKGHVWKATPYTLKSNNSWCHECEHERMQDTLRKIAESKGGRLLSEYKGAKKKVKWQCKEGHVWEAQPDCVKNSNSWCPICSKRR